MQRCEHRSNENCRLMGRPCYGVKHDGNSSKYSVDSWVERSCPNYIAVEGDEIKPHKPENAEVVVRIFGPKELAEACGDEEECVVETLDLDQEILQNLFNRIYGGKVAVESVDTASEDVSMFPEVKRLLDGGAKLVVTINDEIKFVGSIPLPLIKIEIEKLGVERLSPSASRSRR